MLDPDHELFDGIAAITDGYELPDASPLLAEATRRFAAGDRAPVRRGVAVSSTLVGPPAIFVAGFFEGNHGDWNVLVVAGGPLTDTAVCFRDLFHVSAEAGVEYVGHVVDWIFEGYFAQLHDVHGAGFVSPLSDAERHAVGARPPFVFGE